MELWAASSPGCVYEGVCVCGGGGGGCEGVFVVGMGWDTRLALNTVSDGALGSGLVSIASSSGCVCVCVVGVGGGPGYAACVELGE